MEEKKLVHSILLHSNDIHADFSSRQDNEKLTGGISRLSGYIKKVREEAGEDKVVYTISGDMFRGSVVDSEYLGLSTAAIINHLKPDAVCIGNHEIDYGIAHSLLLERVADFPVINCNVYIKYFNKHLYQPYYIKEIGGTEVLFIGVITPEMTKQLLHDASIGRIIEVRDPAEEVNRILDEVGGLERFGAVMILSHIGLDADIELAKKLDPDRVGGIIGGHSHTIMEEPLFVNDIPIVQAGTGTGQIGRFDFWTDPDTREIVRYKWQTVPIDSDLCPVDPEIETLVDYLSRDVDNRYSEHVCTLAERAVNEVRNAPTGLTCLLADTLAEYHGLDIVLMNAGAARSLCMGPEVTRRDVTEAFPYNEALYKTVITVREFKNRLRRFFENNRRDWKDPHAGVLVHSAGWKYTYSVEKDDFLEFLRNGEEADENAPVSVGLVNYLVSSTNGYFGEDMIPGKIRMISEHYADDFMDALSGCTDVPVHNENDRLFIVD